MQFNGKAKTRIAVWGAVFVLGSLLPAEAATDKEKNADTDQIKVKEASFNDIEQRIEQSDADAVLVHVWATWCPPCRKEFPAIVKIARKYSEDKLELILVSADKSSAKERVVDFLENHNSPQGSLIARNPQKIVGGLNEDWEGGIPASFFYNKNGKLEKWWAGAHSFSAYKKTIEKLIGGQAQ